MIKGLAKLTKLKKELDKLVPHGHVLDRNLKYKLWVQFIYGSSVVEGVKLKQSEVEDIIRLGNKSKFLQGNPDPDVIQALGQKYALQAVEKWAKMKKTVTTTLLQELHYLVFEKVDQRAGNFRDAYIELRNSALIPSFPFAIAADMRDFNSWLVAAQKETGRNDLEKIIELITRCYHSVTRIHPFSDGNGRTARLFTNLMLRRYGLPYVFVPKVDNIKEMRTVLRAADMGDMAPMIGFMGGLLEQALKEVINYWRKKKLGKLG